ncbi:ImmA/IrrE family metallo-endopeptidase [Leucobacter sp. NPDC058333]|uniref:ImmA/IrrE family metallo-endopeptidase n=1 Tax=Leucobacter sp. NPDC058333 TaxID=3346450 RepID=UPI00364735F3
MQRVITEAKRQGVALAFGTLPPPQRGAFFADANQIVISDRLDPIQAAESGAHELGHCYFGDRCSTRASEERAWIFAAKILIKLEPYMQAELEDPHPVAIANHLRTTRRMVELYQQHHLHAQALAAPRNIFGQYEDEDYFDDGALMHSLRSGREFRCGLIA